MSNERSAELFMVEVRVADRAASTRWYAGVLGLRPILDDPEGGFALLAAGPGKVALKEGPPLEVRGAVRLVFRVDSVDDERVRILGLGFAVSEVVESAEGYREARLADPDGTPVHLFSEVAARRPAG